MEVKWSGNVEVVVLNSGKKVVTWKQNMIMNVGKDLLCDALAGLADPRVRYVALGVGVTPVAVTQTTLAQEVFRKPVTDFQHVAVGQLKSICSIASYEANVRIGEIGWFAGASATEAKDSGVMIARVLYSIDKNDKIALQITRTDSFV